MKTLRKNPLFLTLALSLTVLVTTAAVGVRDTGSAPADPYRVVFTKFIDDVDLGTYKADETYGESEVLTEIINELAQQGWSHVSLRPMYETNKDVRGLRFLIVSRR